MNYQDTANALKGRTKTKDVTVKSNAGEFTFQIKRLTPKQYAKLTKGKSQNALSNDLGEGYVMLEQVVCECTSAPLITSKSPEQCGENEVSTEDLSLDILSGLFEEIYKFSGIMNDTEEEQKN